MKEHAKNRQPARQCLRQHGAALLIALLMLSATMMLGVSAAQLTLMNEKSSRNDRDREIAFQAAEAALRDAARDLAGGRAKPDAFPAAAGDCHAGLCRSAADTPLWKPANSRPGWMVAAVAYGRFTGYAFPHGLASLAARPPHYLIELLSLATTGAAAQTRQRYRVTAIGFGTRESSRVILQTIHDADASPPIRLSWREIDNQQD